MRQITLGPVTLQTYGLMLSLGLAAALGWFFTRRGREAKSEGLLFAVLAVPLAFLLARLGQCLVSQGWHLFRDGFFFNFRRGGFMLYGAMGGVMLAALIAGRITGASPRGLLDCAAAPGMLVIAVCRFAEGIIGAGYGRSIADWFDPWGEFTYFPMEDPEPLLRFPFGIPDYYGDYHFSVFLLEGLAALLFLYLIRFSRIRKERVWEPGAVFLLALILYAGAQTTLESLRADSLPKWGFVRVNQLLSGAVLVIVTALLCRKTAKDGKGVPWSAWIGIAACMGMILAMEFALEKKIIFLQWMRMDLCYLVMALSSLGLILICKRVWNLAFRRPAGTR